MTKLTNSQSRYEKTLCLKTLVGNLSTKTTSLVNVLGYSSIAVSVKSSYALTLQVFFSDFSTDAVADRQLEYQMSIAADTPSAFILPVRGERVQYNLVPQGVPGANDSLLVNTVLGHSTSYKVV